MLSDPRPGRRTQPASAETGWVLAAGALTALIGAVVLWIVGAWLDPNTDTDAAGGPVGLLAAQATGELPVGGVQLAVFGLGLLLLLGLGAAFVVVALRTSKRRSRVDHLAPKMAKAREFDALTEPAMTTDAERLRADGAGPGVPLAKLVNNGKRLFASWEWVQIWLMGPRAGKTTSVCVPQILETR
ncbi:MAG TPA: conjugal transfer protein TraG, partial [Citricoccus sp.]|nr:conjugal transfer protein TraG [Citricoccus sp.]